MNTASQAAESASDERPGLRAGFLLFGLVAILWTPALAGGFVWDDVSVLVESPRLRSWSALLEVFRQPAMWASDLPVGTTGTYRPLSLGSFVIDNHLFRGRAWGFHLTSVLLHGVTATLLFHLYRRIGLSIQPAFVLALAWAVHPAAVEAVAWINGRSEIFTLLFGCAALLSASPRAVGRRGPRAAVCGALLLLALLGKETGAAFLPLAVAIASGRLTGRRGRVGRSQCPSREPPP